MRLYTYIVKHDKGLAPNPFYGYCTLGLCTPNHMGIKASSGDWIAGFTTSERQNKLVFAMRVAERMHFHDYFHDKRFCSKKPYLTGTWRQRCGDNIYYLQNDEWCQLPSPYHYTVSHRNKDTKHPYVFIAKRFYYFGEKALLLPEKLRGLIWPRQGCRSDFDPELVGMFLGWLKTNFKPGKHGEPMDRDTSDCCTFRPDRGHPIP